MAEECLNVNLVVSGATLLGMIGLAVKVWSANRGTKINPQPLEVRGVERPVAAEVCKERHEAINADHSNLFARMSSAEQRISMLEGTLQEIRHSTASVDAKLTEVLRRLP